jgi:methylmalonyl-CoA/ethylmalonyl-CoA epimerase
MLFDRLHTMPTPVATVMGSIMPGFFQQAYVVADIDAAIEGWTALGVNRFVRLPAADLPYVYRGRDVECALELAFGRVGNIQVELMQPLRGEGVHIDTLVEHGPHANHLGFLVHDVAEVTAAAENAGVGVVQSGEFGTLKFVYLDTWDTLGLYAEVMEDPDDMLVDLMPK